jgi:hypothetical protein
MGRIFRQHSWGAAMRSVVWASHAWLSTCREYGSLDGAMHSAAG